MSFVEVAKVNEILEGHMKHVERGDTEILLAKVDGEIYAVSDRCGHMNARLSMGKLQGKTIICPLHASQFDITTGKNIKDPVLTSIPGADKVPELKKYSERLETIIAPVKTYDLPIFEVKIEGENILIDI
ncbi:Rieske (2Fe-2S) protein [Methanobacterium sp.]|uniref:Rieske (2Fe-2S) protein n=1 Tax=Methanobacterium sp. TaxID=2164 RepID=UPI003C78BA70